MEELDDGLDSIQDEDEKISALLDGLKMNEARFNVEVRKDKVTGVRGLYAQAKFQIKAHHGLNSE